MSNRIRTITLLSCATFLGAQALAQNTSQPESDRPEAYREHTVPSVLNGSKVLYQGDILLEPQSSTQANAVVKPDAVVKPHAVVKPDSISIAYPSTLWPKVSGVATVYYIIDSASDPNATSKIQTAISTFNADFPGIIQWVEWTSAKGPNYVDINLSSTDLSGTCEAEEGYAAIPAEPMTGSTSCTVATILHEMGHIIGLWHEQTRADRNTYLTLNYSNVIKDFWSNYLYETDNQQLLGLFDYASVMEYPPYSFSRNGGPVIETIPAGIPLTGTEGVPVPTTADYSAADKETIERLYGAAPTAVTVTSNPVGLQVIVDGATVTTPQTYNWALNSAHTVNVPTGVQTLTGDIAYSTTSSTFYYTYGRWNDSTSQSHTITVAPGPGSITFPSTSPQVATYSANFIQLVPYTATVYPTSSGSVSISPQPTTYTGATGEFLVARQQATLTASPASGWNFYSFNNGPFYLPGGLASNPKTFYVPDSGNPVNTTAYFSNTPVFTIDVQPDTFSSNLGAIIDNGFWYTPKNFSSYYDSSWTFGSTHSLNITTPQYPYSYASRYPFASWSDGGAQSHSIASLPATSTSYIATVTPQYEPTTNFGYACGGSAAITPASPTNDGYYPKGQVLNFTATPFTGWTFAGWTYDLTGTANPTSLTANDETLVYANFNTTNTPLALTSLSPASAYSGGAAFTLTLNGTGFTSSSLVGVNGTYRTVTYVNSTTIQVPVTAADIATSTAFQVFIENFPSGSNGCAVFGYQTFLVQGPQSSPTVSLSPTSIAFPNQKANTESAAQQVKVTNTGNATLSLSRLALAGANASSFALSSNTCGTTIAAGVSCTVNVQFFPSVAGSDTATVTLTDNAANSPQSVALTGLSEAPSVVFISPSSGSGLTQNFTMSYSDTGGVGALTQLYFLFTEVNSSDACYVNYRPASNQMFLATDAGSGYLPTAVTPGSSATVSNSQCTLSGAGSSVAKSGNTLTLTAAITFNSSFAGLKKVYLSATDANTTTGLIQEGTWTPVASKPSILSISPASGTGLSQTFAMAFSDTGGTSSLTQTYFLFSANGSKQSACFVNYQPVTNKMYLANDAGSAYSSTFVTPGSSNTVSNSQCTISGTGSSITTSGNTLTLHVAITFASTYIGTKTVYLYAADAAANTGYIVAGAWTPVATKPAIVSLSPNSGTGLTQTFAMAFSDTGGASSLTALFFLFSPTSAKQSACFVEYKPATNKLYLANDAGSGYLSTAITPGASTTVSNSQCTLSGTGSSVSTSGNNLTLNVAITFNTSFSGLKNVFLYAGDADANTGYVQEGTWTPDNVVASLKPSAPALR